MHKFSAAVPLSASERSEEITRPDCKVVGGRTAVRPYTLNTTNTTAPLSQQLHREIMLIQDPVQSLENAFRVGILRARGDLVHGLANQV